MDKISTYNVGVTLAALKGSFQEGAIPEELFDPLQSLLQKITERAAAKPISIYLFSDDGNAELRNLFGYALAKALLKHIPSTLLVDCEFLDIGMNGVVPQKDALGFLDLLLYGSSLGVITQETSGGVHVIGAGSFPVTKKMPFILSAFEEAARRLVSFSRCSIFSGPLNGDDGEVHEVVGAVDVPVFVRAAKVAQIGIVDPIEEQIASRWNKEVLSVRIVTSGQPIPAPKAVAEPPRGDVADTPGKKVSEPSGDEPEILQKEAEPVAPPPRREFDESESGSRKERVGPPPGEPRQDPYPTQSMELEEEVLKIPYKEKRYTSLLPRIATWIVGLIIVVFIVWWFMQERTDGEAVTENRVDVPVETAAEESKDGGEVEQADAGTEQVADAGTEQVADAQQGSEPSPAGSAAVDSVPPQEAETTAGESVSGETTTDASAFDTSNILVMDDVEAQWGGQYLIHVSSFKTSALARDEADYLSGRGFQTAIVYLDLGTKGTWYRVYVGPAENREQARSLKKQLDDTPRVRFTSIKRVAGK